MLYRPGQGIKNYETKNFNLRVLDAFSDDEYFRAGDNLKKRRTFDFTKNLVTKNQLAKMEHYDLQILRGIVFGRRGRVLSPIERKNLEKFIVKRNAERKVALSPGEMDKFQNVQTEIENVSILEKAEENAVSKFSEVGG